MKILDKYIVKEMMGPFFFGLATFTILFFAGGQLFMVTKMIAENLVPADVAIEFAFNSLPAIMIFTLPMGVLLAVLLAFGRLSGESELVAIKAGGISFLRTALPALVLALFITIFSYFLNNTLAPEATYRANNIMLNAFLQDKEGIAENTKIEETMEDGSKRIIYFVKLYPSKNLMESVFLHYFKDGKRIRTVFADKVYYKPAENKWYMTDAYIQEFDENQEPKYISHNSKVHMPLNKTPQELSGRERRKEEMSRNELKKFLANMEKDGFEDKSEIKKYLDFEIFYHQKIAIPFTCFVFGMFGIPLGVRPQRTSKAFGLGLSIVFIFAYYILMSTGMVMGQNGKLDTFLAAWLPNMVFTIAGIVLLYQKSTE
ncbi:MAG: LptF/LptG family permease [Vulcanimicrobiota bacterium]